MQVRSRRADLPEYIRDAPELFTGLEETWLAFLELGTCREVGMGDGPVPWWAIERYARSRGLDLEELTYFVRQMDLEFLEFRRKQRGNGGGSDNGGPGP